MNSMLYLFLALLAFSCIGKHKSDAQKATVGSPLEHNVEVKADTLYVNLEKSQIDWVATEMRGAKRRTGVIALKDGLLLSQNGEIVGGNFTVDMTTMDITDVPVTEIIARKNLLNHLKSNDFFDVVNYPASTLLLTSVRRINSDSLKFSGNLCIREVTKSISFFAHCKNGTFKTRFIFNRHDWNIAYKGSWVNKTLVDSDVELTIELVMQ